MKKFDTLTKAEMQVMNALWDMSEGGCIHDIIEKYPEPKPAYTTISTFLKILLNKGFPIFKRVYKFLRLFLTVHIVVIYYVMLC